MRVATGVPANCSTNAAKGGATSEFFQNPCALVQADNANAREDQFALLVPTGLAGM